MIENTDKLFDDTDPFGTHMIVPSHQPGNHQIYVAEYGNRDGVPIVCLHGGPGAPSSSMHRFFDPNYFRIIVPHQRGSGYSRPAGSLDNNNPDTLAHDITTILDTLNIEQAHIYGNSWGAALALIYAQKFPDYVQSLILSATPLMQRDRTFGPAQDVLDNPRPSDKDFVLIAQELDLNDTEYSVFESYYQQIMSDNVEVAVRAARVWLKHDLEKVYDGPLDFDIDEIPAQDLLNSIRIMMHFFKHHSFENDADMLANADALPDIPATFIHGQNDKLVPLEEAYLLHEQYGPCSELVITRGGHSSKSEGTLEAIIEAGEKIKSTQPKPQATNTVTP